MTLYQYLLPSFNLMSSYCDPKKTWNDFPSLAEQAKTLNISQDKYLDKIITWSGLPSDTELEKISDCLERLPSIERQNFNKTSPSTLSSVDYSSRVTLVDPLTPKPILWHRSVSSHLGECYVSGFDDVIYSISLSPSVPSYENDLSSELKNKLFGSSEIKLYNHGTNFDQEVRKRLLNLPPFQTISYGSLYQRTARAVGGTMRRNPFLIVIPCHRVMGHNFSLTGYAGSNSKGLTRKIAAILWDRLQSL